MSNIKTNLKVLVAYRDDMTCQYCGEKVTDPSKLNFDHVIPLASGGVNDDRNIVVSCVTCNKLKANAIWEPSNLSALSERDAEWARTIAQKAVHNRVLRNREPGTWMLGKPGRPPKNGKTGKRWNIYCTEEDRAIVRSLLALSPEQKAYVKGWIDRGANIGGKK